MESLSWAGVHLNKATDLHKIFSDKASDFYATEVLTQLKCLKEYRCGVPNLLEQVEQMFPGRQGSCTTS